jgi:predicted phage tail protein
MQSGIVYFVRDSAMTTPVALFSPRNMVKNSLNLSYALPNEDSGDAVDVSYFDSGTWQTKTVRAIVDTEVAPVKVNLFGVTDRAHVWREGMYMAACNRYRRRNVTFRTEMEGFIVSFGDLIAINHDMPQWGQVGEITAWDAGTLTATCSQTPDFSAGGTHQIALRKRDGSIDGPYTVTAGIPAKTLVFSTAPLITPYTGHAEERTHYAFGPITELYITARVRNIRPKSDHEVEIVSVIESAAVHTADTGTAAGETAWQLPTRITRPVLLGLMVRSDPDTVTNMFLSWQPSPAADHYLVEVSDSGLGWTRIGDTTATNFTATATYGSRTQIRVAAVGLTQSAWVEINYGSSASYMWDAVTTTLMWDTTTPPGDGSAVSMWSY